MYDCNQTHSFIYGGIRATSSTCEGEIGEGKFFAFFLLLIFYLQSNSSKKILVSKTFLIFSFFRPYNGLDRAISLDLSQHEEREPLRERERSVKIGLFRKRRRSSESGANVIFVFQGRCQSRGRCERGPLLNFSDLKAPPRARAESLRSFDWRRQKERFGLLMDGP